jgi:hypothetical protein
LKLYIDNIDIFEPISGSKIRAQGENMKKLNYLDVYPKLMAASVVLFLALIIVGPKIEKKINFHKFLVSLRKEIKSHNGELEAKPFTSINGEQSGHDYASKALKSQPIVVSEVKKDKVALKSKTAHQSKQEFCFAKKKGRNNKEEKEIQNHIEAAKKRYSYYMKYYGKMTYDSCEKKGIEPDFGIALFLNEGGGNSFALSDSGALGLTQLMRRTAIRLWKKRHENIPNNIDSALRVPAVSISLGTDHLKESFDFFESPVKAAIAYWSGNNGVYNYFCKYDGKDVDVEYYRIVYGIYKWIKEQKGEECSPAMKPAKPPEIAFQVAQK